MQIGKYKLYLIDSVRFSLDGGAMFGIIPKVLWEKTNPPDEKNRIPLAARNMLLISESRKILIDTGMGEKWEEKEREIYRIEQNEHSLENSIRKIGVQPEEITDVILTHLHFDHTGGSTKIENGKIIPAFSNAKFYAPESNYNWAINPSERDRGSYLKNCFVPLMENGVLNLIYDNSQFDDEIEFISVNGHTFGQQLVKIFDGEKTFLFCGDLFPTSTHIRLPYIMGYDLQPLITLEEKKNILELAASQNWKLVFEHDPYHAAASIVETEKGYQIGEKYNEL
jgi:glyoxylase-like metal-dependent hydrolase (beta-lactamase superfamily II)